MPPVKGCSMPCSGGFEGDHGPHRWKQVVENKKVPEKGSGFGPANRSGAAWEGDGRRDDRGRGGR